MYKELKKMKKIELMELLLEQEKEITKLTDENQKLNQQLNEKILKIEESGSIAEAALKLSDIFESAQRAVDIYLSNLIPEERNKVEEQDESESSNSSRNRERITETATQETE